MKERIKLENVIKMFDPDVRAVNHVNLMIEAGTFTIIDGPRSCGKTTLMRLMNGIYRPSEGNIYMLGNAVHNNSEMQNARLRNELIGTLNRTPVLIPEMTVLENISLPLRIRGISKKDAESEGVKVLESLGIETYQSYKTGQMSLFEKHLVCLAGEMIKKPRILLCDDVLSTLQGRQQEVYANLLKVLFETEDLTVIYFGSKAEGILEDNQYYKMDWGTIDCEEVLQ